MRIVLDWETRSRSGIKDVGSWNYIRHESTEPLCLGYTLDGRDYKIWKPGQELPDDLCTAIKSGAEVWAHNAFFERLIHRFLCPRYGFPEVRPEQWRCSMALAAAHGLPRALKDACKAMRLSQQKDTLGRKLITMLSSPRSNGGWWAEPSSEEFDTAMRWAVHFRERHTDEIELNEHASFLRRQLPEVFRNQSKAKVALAYAAMDLYCLQDVRATVALIDALPPWPKRELKIWQLDQEINLRGIPIDVETVQAARECRDQIAAVENARLQKITERSPGRTLGHLNLKPSDKPLLLARMQTSDSSGEEFSLVTAAGETVRQWFIPYAFPDTRPEDIGEATSRMQAELSAMSLREGVDYTVSHDSVDRSGPSPRFVTCGLAHVASADDVRGLTAWANANGADLPNLQKPTVETWLTDRADFLKPEVIEVLKIRQSLSRKSVAKYDAMHNRTCPETRRCYETLAYFGGHTGRWAGRGVQFQNLARGGVWASLAKDADVGIVTQSLLDLINNRDVEGLDLAFGDPMEALSSGIRSCVRSDDPDRPLIVYDFAGIEARVLAWLAGQEDAVQLFRDGADIYVEMASSIFSKSPDEVTKHERMIGKIAILGLGYGMGAAKFADTVESWGLERPTDEFAKEVVDAYRGRFRKIKNLWYKTDEAAKTAIECRGQLFRVGRTAWKADANWLRCRLPNGRKFYYPRPSVERVEKWGQMTDEIRYWTVDSVTRQFKKTSTYGGKLVENLVQAVARDLLVDAMFRLEAAGFRILCTIHDEIVCQKSDKHLELADVERLMTVVPDWADGCPIAVEGFEAERYRK